MDLHLAGALQGELAAGVAKLAAGALIAGLWQGVLLSLAVGVLLRVMPKGTAALRFAVWTAVFCASVALPFVNLPAAVFAGRTGASAVPHLTVDLRWSYLLTGFWLAASAYRLVELALQAAALRALWKSARPVAGWRLEAPFLVVGQQVELCTSDEVDRPSVIGFFAPKILIPAWLLEQLTAVELNHIVLHEMEHLRRHDDWVNLLQKIGLVLLPLNPALFWIDRRLSTERELACDDGVLERTKMPRAYAASLASVAERRLNVRLHRRTGALALTATGLRQRRSELGQRIESILGLRTPVNRVLATGAAAVMVAAVMGSAVALARAPQLVAFVPGEAAKQAVVRPTGAEPGSVVAPVPTGGRVEPVASYRAVSFREPTKVRAKKNVSSELSSNNKIRDISESTTSNVKSAVPLRRKQLVVLTSWEEDTPVTRVVVATPDGRFFLAPYAAVPTQTGWLLIQL